MMGVRVTAGPEFVAGQPSRLFSSQIEPSPFLPSNAVTADGQRFLVLEALAGESSPLTFLLNGLDPNPVSTSIR
jgi:hypothetical protein